MDILIKENEIRKIKRTMKQKLMSKPRALQKCRGKEDKKTMEW